MSVEKLFEVILAAVVYTVIGIVAVLALNLPLHLVLGFTLGGMVSRLFAVHRRA